MEIKAEDPLAILVSALREHRAPSLAWCVEFAPAGRISRAWALTTDPDAMREILGTTVWTGEAWIPKGKGLSLLASPLVQAVGMIGLGMLADAMIKRPAPAAVAAPAGAAGILSAAIAPVAFPITSSLHPYALSLVRLERTKVANRVRDLHPVPPTLKELFERYGVGTHAKK